MTAQGFYFFFVWLFLGEWVDGEAVMEGEKGKVKKKRRRLK